VHVVGQGVAAELADGLHAAGDVAAQRLSGPDERVQQQVRGLGGGVGDHRQLFEDDEAFLLDL